MMSHCGRPWAATARGLQDRRPPPSAVPAGHADCECEAWGGGAGTAEPQRHRAHEPPPPQ